MAFHDLAQDVRISARTLLRAPTLTITILLTVGLGIGATTAIFAAIDAAMLRPLPYADPGRLVQIYTDTPPFKFRFSVADYQALEAQQTHFSRVAAYTGRTMAYTDGTVAERLIGRGVTWTYFGVLGIQPALGRDFTEADSRVGAPPAVIVSRRFWQERLSSRADVVGSQIRLDGTPHTIAGVLGPIVGPLEQRQDFFVAAQWTPPRRRGPFFWTVIARLRDGVEPASAASELRAINKRIFPIWKSSYQDERATWGMIGLKTFTTGDVGTVAGLSIAAVVLVWLIACANASNLVVARVTSRRRELAVRSALGASRGRVLRHLLVECGLLAVGSAVIGVGIAWLGIDVLRGLIATYYPRTQALLFNGPVTWVLAGVTLASGALFGVLPALQGTKGTVNESLQGASRGATASIAVRRLRRVLVASQFAIATPLLVVAGLLLVSLNALFSVDLGFETRTVLTGSIQLPAAQYGEPGALRAFWDEFRRRVEAVPGVTAVAFADGVPPAGVGNFNNFDLEDRPAGLGGSQPVTPWVAVTPEYFKVLGLTLLEGRLLTERDVPQENLEWVVVDAAWARRFFPNGSAIGKRFRSGGCTECPWTTVVGVVSTVKYAGVDAPDEGSVYTVMPPDAQQFFVIRTATTPANVVPQIRQALRELDPTVPLSNVATAEELVSQSLQTPRYMSVLVGAFAAVALLLSVIGIYGVMAYYVQQHAKDISIRLALGGTPRDVLRLVLSQGMRVVVLGIVVGLATAFAATRLMSSLLFGVGAADPATYAAAGVLLLLTALSACLIPARRAIGLEPAAVLRQE